MVAGVLIRCEPQQETEVLDALRKLEGLSYVYQLFGRYDMVALIRSLDLHAASEVVGAHPGHRRCHGHRDPRGTPELVSTGVVAGRRTFSAKEIAHMGVKRNLMRLLTITRGQPRCRLARRGRTRPGRRAGRRP